MAITKETRFGVDQALQAFDKTLESFSKKAARAALFRVRRLARSLHTRIVRGTPVDTGRARSSWNLSVDEPNLAINEPPRGGLSGNQAADIAIKTQKQLQKFKDPATQKIYISNGVPYIERIERGDYSSAPEGMVEVNMHVVASVLADEPYGSEDEAEEGGD